MDARTHSRWIVPLVIVVIVAGIWWMRRRPPQYSHAYIGDRAVVLWSTTAQVRRQVATLHYGERVDILAHSADQVQVRSDNGAQGWMDARLLMDPAVWQQASDLLHQVRTMPVQAVGHTRARSNVHIEPGRDTRAIFQFGPNEQVAVFSRKVVTVSRAGEAAAASDDKNDAAPDAAPAPTKNTPAPAPTKGTPVPTKDTKDKDEDWLLVLRSTAATASGGAGSAGGGVSSGSDAGPGATPDASGPIAGWVLGQFVALDPPGPITDYTNAAGMRPVAWAVLNTVPDAGGAKPQYLVAATHGGQDRACDFTGVRVYTWGAARQRYETAYVENDLCGQMPIRVKPALGGAEFQFPEADENGDVRVYRMNQTVVRRVREEPRPPKKQR
jgi:hypothetical protein